MKKLFPCLAALVLAAALSAQTVTPVLGLKITPIGSPAWGPGVNNNFQLIDAAVGALQASFQGAWASNKAYGNGQFVTYTGSVFISTVANNINHTPGIDSNWQLISASLPAPGGLGNAPVSNGSVYVSTPVLVSSYLGAANGVAPLDGSLLVPVGNLPAVTAAHAGIVPLFPNNTTTFFRGDGIYAAIPAVSTSAAGLAPTLPGTANTFFHGDGSYSALPAVSSSVAGIVPAFPGNTTTFYRGDGSYAALPLLTTSLAGLAPQLPGNTTSFLRGDGTWAVPPGGAGGFTPTNSASNASQVVRSNFPASTYSWAQLTADDIAAGFSASFAGGQTLEIAQSVVNPAFTASYSATPASAQITNTDGIGSPTVLNTPFTSGTIIGTFTKAAQGTTTFTLTAVSTGGVTKTPTQAFTFLPRIFNGVAAAGATSTVTASGANAVLSNGSSLSSAGLTNSGSEVGKVFGPMTAAGQKVYLLMSGGSHTFKDNSTGFVFVFNAPTAVTFTNQFGGTVSMWLYESTNILTGTYSVLTVS